MSARAASADNVMRSMEPGESYDIEIAHAGRPHPRHLLVSPAPPRLRRRADGERHGRAPSIIEGDFADVPEIAAARERLLVLTQVVFDAFGMVEDFGTLFPETATRFLAINGSGEPTIDHAARRGAALAHPRMRPSRTTCC